MTDENVELESKLNEYKSLPVNEPELPFNNVYEIGKKLYNDTMMINHHIETSVQRDELMIDYENLRGFLTKLVNKPYLKQPIIKELYDKASETISKVSKKLGMIKLPKLPPSGKKLSDKLKVPIDFNAPPVPPRK